MRADHVSRQSSPNKKRQSPERSYLSLARVLTRDWVSGGLGDWAKPMLASRNTAATPSPSVPHSPSLIRPPTLFLLRRLFVRHVLGCRNLARRSFIDVCQQLERIVLVILETQRDRKSLHAIALPEIFRDAPVFSQAPERKLHSLPCKFLIRRVH